MPPADGEVRRLLGEQAVPSGEGGELQAAVCPEFHQHIPHVRAGQRGGDLGDALVLMREA